MFWRLEGLTQHTQAKVNTICHTCWLVMEVFRSIWNYQREQLGSIRFLQAPLTNHWKWNLGFVLNTTPHPAELSCFSGLNEKFHVSRLCSNNTVLAFACGDKISRIFLIPEMFITTYMQNLKTATQGYKENKMHPRFILDRPLPREKKPLWFKQSAHTSTLTPDGSAVKTPHLSFTSCPLYMAPILYSLWPKWSGYKAKLMLLVLEWLFLHLCIPQLSESQKELLRIEFTLPERWQTEGGRGREHRRPADPFFNLSLWTPFFPLWVSHRPEARLTLPLRYKESRVDVSCFFQSKHSTNSTGRQLAKLSL